MPTPTVVLVHGAGTSSSLWAPVQRELALLGHRSYAIDLPGHGLDAQYSPSYQLRRTWTSGRTSRRRWPGSRCRTA